jgi:hypothetical protein
MTELPESSQHPSKTSVGGHAGGLLRYYSFELGEYAVDHQITEWIDQYPVEWILPAITEALYQGRYKTISIDQILQLWQRRGQTACHFTREFERIVNANIPCLEVAHLEVAPSDMVREVMPKTEMPKTELVQPDPPFSSSSPTTPLASIPPLSPEPNLSYRKLLLQLPSSQAISNLKLREVPEIPSLQPPQTPTKLTLLLSELHASELGALQEPQQSEFAAPPRMQALELKEGQSSLFKLSDPKEQVVSSDSISGAEDDSLALETQKSSAEKNAPTKATAEKAMIESDREFKDFKEGVLFALSSGLAARFLQPRLRLELSRIYQLDWFKFSGVPSSIDQFVPASETSEFHNKLKSVVNKKSEVHKPSQNIPSQNIED